MDDAKAVVPMDANVMTGAPGDDSKPRPANGPGIPSGGSETVDLSQVAARLLSLQLAAQTANPDADGGGAFLPLSRRNGDSVMPEGGSTAFVAAELEAATATAGSMGDSPSQAAASWPASPRPDGGGRRRSNTMCEEEQEDGAGTAAGGENCAGSSA